LEFEVELSTPRLAGRFFMSVVALTQEDLFSRDKQDTGYLTQSRKEVGPKAPENQATEGLVGKIIKWQNNFSSRPQLTQ
jgi:hypothetical protein